MKVQADGKTYDYQPDRLMYSEAKLIQKHTGMKLDAWQAGLRQMDPDAIAALLFTLRRRAGEALEWDAFDFDLGTFGIEDDEEPDPKAPAPAASGSDSGTS